MKKVICLLLVLLLVLGLAACGEPTGKRLGRNKTVALVTCENSACAICAGAEAGLKTAEAEFQMAVTLLRAGSAEDREAQLLAAAAEAPNLVLAGCPALAQAAESVAKQNPNLSFAVLDAVTSGTDNLLGITFAEYEGAYLAGILAGFSGQTVVGFVGAEEDAAGKAQEAAFKAGLKAAGSAATVLVSYVGYPEDVALAADLIKAQKSHGAAMFFVANPYADSSLCDYGVKKCYDIATHLVIETALKGELAGGIFTTFGVKEDCVTYIDFAGQASAAALELLNGSASQIKEGTLSVPKGVN